MSARSVYVIRSESGPVKVGIARNPRGRLAQLRTASATCLHLDFAAQSSNNMFALERRVHEILDARRLSGEWFNASVHGAIGAIIQAAQELDLDLRDCTLPKNSTDARTRTLAAATAARLTGVEFIPENGGGVGVRLRRAETPE